MSGDGKSRQERPSFLAEPPGSIAARIHPERHLAQPRRTYTCRSALWPLSIHRYSLILSSCPGEGGSFSSSATRNPHGRREVAWLYGRGAVASHVWACPWQHDEAYYSCTPEQEEEAVQGRKNFQWVPSGVSCHQGEPASGAFSPATAGTVPARKHASCAAGLLQRPSSRPGWCRHGFRIEVGGFLDPWMKTRSSGGRVPCEKLLITIHTVTPLPFTTGRPGILDLLLTHHGSVQATRLPCHGRLPENPTSFNPRARLSQRDIPSITTGRKQLM